MDSDISTYNTRMLDGILSDSGASLIPESLATALTIGVAVLSVLGVLFFIFYVVSSIRKWRVDSALLQMQKDVAEIKTQMARRTVTDAPTNQTTES